MTPDACAGHAAGPHCDQWPHCFVPTSRLEECADELDGALAAGDLPDPDGTLARLVTGLRTAIHCEARA